MKRNRVSEIVDLHGKVPMSTPYILYIDPSGACNLQCKFCPCNMESFMADERHKIMDMEMYKKIVSDLDAFPEKVEIVYLYAFGEPLINPNFCDMVSLLKDKCSSIRTVSNGTLLSCENNRKIVESGLDYIRISVEAMSTEGYMSISHQKIDFDKYVDNIADLFHRSRNKMEIGIRIISAGLKDEAEAKRFFKIFEPISDYANIDNVRDIWPESKNTWKAGVGKYQEEDNYYGKGGKCCSVPLYSMTVHSNGIVSACPDDWRFAKVMGDVKTDSLIHIWNSKELHDLRLDLLGKGRDKVPFCEACDAKSIVDIDDYRGEILKNLCGGSAE